MSQPTKMISLCLATILYLTASQRQTRVNRRPKQIESTNCNGDWSNYPNYDSDAERVYHIACVEMKWNYCPTGYDLIRGEPIREGTEAAIWCLGNNAHRIGATYWKGLYREFEDKCFSSQKRRSDRDLHLGVLGPNIRAMTGETIKVYYKNTCSFPNSLHAHGLLYDKTSEGAYYDDGNINGGDIVQPGQQWIYKYKVRDNMVDEGASSKMWLYHSHVDEPRDVMTGLIGAIIISKDESDFDGYNGDQNDIMPDDIDEEFTTFFVLFDENESHLFDKNLQEYLDLSINDNGIDLLLQDNDFIESNLMHSINGYLFGNLQGLIMDKDDDVRWYTASFGNELDGPHSPHWHGNIAVDALGDNTDTVVLIPGTTYTVTMDCDAPGLWLYHCHVHDHIDAGMITTYLVDDTNNGNGNTMVMVIPQW
eukprot:94422_1